MERLRDVLVRNGVKPDHQLSTKRIILSDNLGMGYSIGFDYNWQRDIGYGVPSVCDHPGCNEEIHRGLGYVCGGDFYGGDDGCGLFFCGKHLFYTEATEHVVCERCVDDLKSFRPKDDLPHWVYWKLTDESWAEWRSENPDKVARLQAVIDKQTPEQIEAIKKRLSGEYAEE